MRHTSRAARALEFIGEPAVAPLIEALQDENADIRSQAAKILGKISDPRAVHPLVQALDDRDERVRGSSFFALHMMLKSGGEGINQAFIQELTENPGRRQGKFIQLMDQTTDPCFVEPLIETLRDAPDDIKKGTIKALANIGDTRAVEALIDELMHAEGPIPGYAAYALGRIGDPRAVGPMINTLLNQDSKDYYSFENKINIIHALGKIGDPSAVELLTQFLWDSGGTYPADENISSGPPGDSRAAGPLITGWGTVGGAAAGALGDIGDVRAVEPLIKALRTMCVDVRSKTALALAKIGDARAIEPLIEALKDGSFEVRLRASQSLGRIGDSRAVLPLIQVRDRDHDAHVRGAARDALDVLSRRGVWHGE